MIQPSPPTPRAADLTDPAELLYDAWCLIANVSVDADEWAAQSPEWAAAARRFRDAYLQYLHDTGRPEPTGQPPAAPDPAQALTPDAA